MGRQPLAAQVGSLDVFRNRFDLPLPLVEIDCQYLTVAAVHSVFSF
jgi:hypothetical protein